MATAISSSFFILFCSKDHNLDIPLDSRGPRRDSHHFRDRLFELCRFAAQVSLPFAARFRTGVSKLLRLARARAFARITASIA